MQDTLKKQTSWKNADDKIADFKIETVTCSCTGCKNVIVSDKEHYSYIVPFEEGIKELEFCSNHQKEYMELCVKIRKEKELKLLEFLANAD